jgi:hypothetical protein
MKMLAVQAKEAPLSRPFCGLSILTECRQKPEEDPPLNQSMKEHLPMADRVLMSHVELLLCCIDLLLHPSPAGR